MTPAPDYLGRMPHAPSAPVITIRPPKGWAPLDLREFVGTHELLYFLVLRNLKLRYKQTASRRRVGRASAAAHHGGLQP